MYCRRVAVEAEGRETDWVLPAEAPLTDPAAVTHGLCPECLTHRFLPEVEVHLARRR